VVGFYEMLEQMFVLFLFGFFCDVSWCMVVVVFIDVMLFSLCVVVGSIVSSVGGVFGMPVLPCHVETVVRSWQSAIIRSLLCGKGCGGCDQNIGAHRVSSMHVTHFLSLWQVALWHCWSGCLSVLQFVWKTGGCHCV